jgi:hypothetical protein
MTARRSARAAASSEIRLPRRRDVSVPDNTGGVGTHLEDIDIWIDGKSVSLFHYEGRERGGVGRRASRRGSLHDDLIAVKAGQQLVSAAFVRRTDGPYEDLIKPHDCPIRRTAPSGTTTLPHVMELTVIGPRRSPVRTRRPAESRAASRSSEIASRSWTGWAHARIAVRSRSTIETA